MQKPAAPQARTAATGAAPHGTCTTSHHSHQVATTMMGTAAGQVSRRTRAETNLATGNRPKGSPDATAPRPTCTPVGSPGPRPAHHDLRAQTTTSISNTYTTYDAQPSGSHWRHLQASANTCGGAVPTGRRCQTAAGSTTATAHPKGVNTGPDSRSATRLKPGGHKDTNHRDAGGRVD